MAPNTIWIILIICALMCSLGFYRFYYFMSVGYGLAIAGAGLVISILYGNSLTFITRLLCILYVLYGIRLSGFLIYREWKSINYKDKIVKPLISEPMPIFVKVMVWLCVAVLYVTLVAPVLYRASNGHNGNIFAYIGAIIMFVGLVVETIADYQKYESKKVNPNRYCDSGLYKIVRCPNYFGETLFWTGSIISGISALTVPQWIVVSIGYITIIYVMLSGAKRIEDRQNKTYGNDPNYQEYIKKTPIIIPFVHLNHLQKNKFIVK